MKRTSITAPLTEDDVAERLDRAALRALRILMEVRQEELLWDAVCRSRYLRPGTLEMLRDELLLWVPR